MTIKKLKRKRPGRGNAFEVSIKEHLGKTGCSFSYETEKIPYVIAGHYIPDFIIDTPTGKVYVEAKGYLRPEHKRKMIAVKKCNPNIDLRILFYASRKENNKWAEKNGFRYAIKSVPEEWIQGL
jgi:predicted nuclease of restriction endonuclease-like RecB superfamily